MTWVSSLLSASRVISGPAGSQPRSPGTSFGRRCRMARIVVFGDGVASGLNRMSEKIGDHIRPVMFSPP